MKEFFKYSILDELYESKEEDFFKMISKELRDQNKKFGDAEAGEKIRNKFMEFISEEEKQKELLKDMDDYESEIVKTGDFWKRMYYKLGVFDSIDIKEVMEYKNNSFNEDSIIDEDIFLDNYEDEFIEYLARKLAVRLKRVDNYVEIEEKISEIKKEDLNLRLLLEDEEKVKLSEEDIEKLIEILELKEKLRNIEDKEIFKLGAREMLVFLKQMKLI